MTTYREVFAEPRFRGLFIARTVWMVAGTLRILTMSVVVYQRTGSPLLGALAFGAGFLPQAVSGLLLGAVADRVAARRLILGEYLAEAVITAALALLHPPVGLALALIAGIGCLAPLGNGATGRLVADALTGDAYVLGRAAISMSSSAAQLVGLAAGGAAVAALGPTRALLLACAGNVLAALLFTGDAPRSPGRGPVLRDSWVGARRLLGDRPVRRLLLVQWLPPAFSTGGESLLIPYASDRGWSSGIAGLLLAAAPLGMLAGDLIVSRLLPPATRERIAPLLVAVLGAPLTLLAAHPPPAVAIGLLAVSGFGLSYLLGLQRAFLDAVPADARGQAFTLLSTGMMTLQGLGPLLMGVAAEALGTGPVIAAAGAAIVLVASVLIADLARRHRQVREDDTAW